MKNIIKTIITFTVIAVFSEVLPSCKDFLNVDKYFDSEFNLDSTFTQSRYVEAYMWGMTTYIPDEARVLSWANTPGPYATDEAITSIQENNSLNGASFVMGHIAPDNLRELNTWGDYYKVIRICNTILTRMNEAPDMTPADHRKIEGYTRFFRAYAYYHLLMNFGPPILLGDEVVNNNEDITYYDRARCTYDEAVAYICDEFEAAAILMPVTVNIMDFGLPTRGAALALIARIRLIHASPAYNGGDAARNYFGNWRRKTDQMQYVSQSYEEKRWAIAAAAAYQVMNLQFQGAYVYSLNTVDATDETPVLPNVASDPDFNAKSFPDGALGIDHYRSYADLFNGEAMAPNVKEYIWAKNSSEVKDVYSIGAFPPSIGGWGRYSVSLKMVDAYRMNDGRTFDEATPEEKTGFLGRRVDFSGYRLLPSVHNMNVGREMRYYASIGFNQAFWECASVNDAPVSDGSGNKEHIANYYAGGWDGKGSSTGVVSPYAYPITGFVVKKWINPSDAFQGGQNRRMNKVYAIIRYAEILLSYAEALNNLTVSHDVESGGQTRTFFRDREAIKKAFNQVRYRAGLPGITDAELNDPAKVQALIEQERMVEFMFENRRYFDVRRWGIYEETENEAANSKGLNPDIDEGSREDYYQRITLSGTRGRIVHRKLMFVPIPRAELRRLPSLDQNPGWN